MLPSSALVTLPNGNARPDRESNSNTLFFLESIRVSDPDRASIVACQNPLVNWSERHTHTAYGVSF